MPSQIKLLHCLGQRAYLESALRNGFMLTDHRVALQFSRDHGTLINQLLKPMIPFIAQGRIREKVERVVAGNPVPSGDPEISRLMLGIGGVTIHVPMLCFTEVVGDGRDLNPHVQTFGRYAVVVDREWVTANGGDRVIYVGDGRAASMHLARILGALRLLSSHRASKPGQFLFDSRVLPLVFEFASFVEIVDHLEEFEWRIVGNTGVNGGAKETGKKIVCPLNQITQVYVDDVGEVSGIVQLLSDRALREGYAGDLPSVEPIDQVLRAPYAR